MKRLWKRTFESSRIQKFMRRIVHKLTYRELPSVAHYLSNEKFVSLDRSTDVYAENDWDQFVVKIAEEFEGASAGFLRAPTISRTVHPNQQDLARRYLEELSENAFSRDKILPRLHDVPLGNPYLCSFFPVASPMSVQHAYYLWMIKEHLGLFLPEDNITYILEVGGGYGNFCRLTFELGFSGRYIIADLPIMNAMQRHYLSFSLPSKVFNDQIAFCSMSDTLALPDSRPSVLIATFSLSEMPIPTRRLAESIYSKFDYVFIAYNRAFGGVDNREYFDRLASNLEEDFCVSKIEDRHRPAWFLLCKRSCPMSNDPRTLTAR